MSNILTNSFSNLFGTIWDGITWLGNLLNSMIQSVINTIVNGFQSIIDLFVGFFKIIYAIIDGLFYFIEKLVTLVVLFFQIIFNVAKLIFSFMQGMARTMQSLFFDPINSSNLPIGTTIGRIFNIIEPMQLNVVATILLFSIWVVTAIGVMSLISSVRVGGS